MDFRGFGVIQRIYNIGQHILAYRPHVLGISLKHHEADMTGFPELPKLKAQIEGIYAGKRYRHIISKPIGLTLKLK